MQHLFFQRWSSFPFLTVLASSRGSRVPFLRATLFFLFLFSLPYHNKPIDQWINE